MHATTIAVDLAKNVFEVAEADRQDRVLARRRLTRAQFARLLRDHPPAEILMEACGTAHYWGRTARGHGHQVTLLPAQHVRPFVRRQKTDRTDVTGLLDARRSDGIMPVPIKTIEQQALLGVHRIRSQWQSTRTARINTLRGLLSEHGVVIPKGAGRVVASVWAVLEDATVEVPRPLRHLLGAMVEEIRQLEQRLAALDRELRARTKEDAVLQRLLTVPGVGVVTSTALVGSVPHIHGFRRARQFASWLGLTPRVTASGERRSLGRITKQGDVYLRTLLIHGARAVLLAAARRPAARRSTLQHWVVGLAERRGHNRAAVALANKLARIIWAVWRRDVDFVSRPLAA